MARLVESCRLPPPSFCTPRPLLPSRRQSLVTAEGRGGLRGRDGGPPRRGCLDNIRNRGQGLFRLRGAASCISHSRWGRGGGRGWMWQRQAPAGAPTPPPLLRSPPWLQPWHRTHLAQASPRPNVPLRSGAACRSLRQCQVSVGLLSSGTGSAPSPTVPSPGPSEKGLSHPPVPTTVVGAWARPFPGWLTWKWSGEGGRRGVGGG